MPKEINIDVEISSFNYKYPEIQGDRDAIKGYNTIRNIIIRNYNIISVLDDVVTKAKVREAIADYKLALDEFKKEAEKND